MSRRTRKRARADLSDSDIESDEDFEPKSNTKSKSKSKTKSKSPTKKKSSKSPSKRKTTYASESESESDSEEEDDDITIGQIKAKSKSKAKTKTKTTRSRKSNSNSNSNSPKSKSKTSKSRKNKNTNSIDDEDTDDELAPPPRKKSRRIASNTEKKNNEFASEFDYVIDNIDTMITVYPRNFEARTKVACFDMDSTLVCPKGKNKFPSGRRDWRWQFASVPKKLKSLYNDENYRIVIFTNQGGIEKGKQRASDIYGKIIDLSNELGIPITGLISTAKDYWRKPNTFMFNYFINNLHNTDGGDNSNNNESNDGTKTKSKDNDNNEEKRLEIDYENSFYCGDAAGRPAGWNGDKKCKRDFSVSDRKFAANCGLKFYTPEPMFLKHNECKNFEWRALDPKEYLKQHPEENYQDTKSWFHGKLPIAKKDGLDMVIMCGPPGAGKSTIATKFLQSEGYVWVNRDTLGTQAKCQKLADTALSQGKNVVIDNTNPDSYARGPYIDIGNKYSANIRIFFMNVSKELAEHMNLYREKMTDGDRKRIPGMVFNMFFKKLREDGKPNAKDEGVNEVVTIDIIPKFDSDKYRKWFLEWN